MSPKTEKQATRIVKCMRKLITEELMDATVL
jgi:hypothetical protein